MRPNFVLIDFQNVQPASLVALEKDHFHVAVFVGANQTKVSMDLTKVMLRMAPRAQIIQISGNGPNALDFHIAFYIGLWAEKHPDAFFHIISEDKGFDPLIDHLKSKKIFCLRSLTIDDIPLVKGASARSPGARAEAFVEKLKRMNGTRPRVAKTLASAVATHFQKQLSDDDIQAVILALKKGGYVDISATGKVTYPNGT